MQRRTFIVGAMAAPFTLYVPGIQAGPPAQLFDTVEYHCDPGERAVITILVSGPGTLTTDWHYRTRFNRLTVRRRMKAVFSANVPVTGHFHPFWGEQLVRVVWSCTVPATFVFGSCLP